MTMTNRRTWLAAMAFLVMAPAWAQRGPRPFLQRPNEEQQRQPLPRQQEQPAVRPDLRQERPNDGRMTPEERRQLRRDIGDAGRELYRRPPPHRRF
jgi:hypothetical protein